MEGKFIRFKLQEIYNTVTKQSYQTLNTSQKIFFYRTQYKLISVYHKCEFVLVLISKMMNLLLYLFMYSFIFLFRTFFYVNTCSCISENCQCAQISLQNWYNIDGRLIANFNYTDPPMLFECNDVCGCNKLLCKNRVVQNGVKLPLTVFECDDKVKGFGVKCLTRIRKGSFVAQYLGMRIFVRSILNLCLIDVIKLFR